MAEFIAIWFGLSYGLVLLWCGVVYGWQWLRGLFTEPTQVREDNGPWVDLD